MYLNDIAVSRAQNVSAYIPKPYADLRPFQLFTLGKRNDLQTGFTSFELGDMKIWEKADKGFPFPSIGMKIYYFKLFFDIKPITRSPENKNN